MPDDTQANRGEPSERDTPRAFVTGTGVVFQFVGVLYFLAAAAYWFLSGRLQNDASVPIERFADYWAEPNRALTLDTINVLASFCGGLAMAALGIGLQGEQRGSGRAALFVTGVLALIHLAATVGYWAVGPHWFGMLVSITLAAAATVMFLLAGHSAGQLRRHPPPEDASIVDDAWLEEYERIRRASRRNH